MMLRTTAAMIAASMLLLAAFAAGAPTATSSTNATGVDAAACADDSEFLGLLIAEENPSRDNSTTGCAKLTALHACDHPMHGREIRAACPVSCGACPSKCGDVTSTLIDAEQSDAQVLAADANTTVADGEDDDASGARRQVTSSLTAQDLPDTFRVTYVENGPEELARVGNGLCKHPATELDGATVPGGTYTRLGLRVRDGTGDNEGTMRERLGRCAYACRKNRYDLSAYNSNSHNTPWVSLGFGFKTNGRCYCHWAGKWASCQKMLVRSYTMYEWQDMS